MIDWDTLRVVLAVHRMGGLSGASRDLQVSQPTVSRHLAKAETDLQCKLFDRRQGRLVTTEAGLIVVREAERMERQVRDIQESVRSIDNEMSGSIRISLPNQLLPYCVAAEIRDFQALHPDIRIAMTINDELDDISTGAVDVVFRAEANPKPSLWGHRISELGYSYFAHRDLAEKFQSPDLPLSQAQDLPLILHDPISGVVLEEFNERFPNGRIVATSNNLEASATLVAQGMGVCRLPQLVGTSLPNVQVIEHSTAGPTRSLWILTHKDLRSIKRIVAFIDFVHQRLTSCHSVFKLPEPPTTD